MTDTHVPALAHGLWPGAACRRLLPCLSALAGARWGAAIMALFFVFALCVLPLNAHAADREIADARQQLQSFVDQVHSAAGQFRQSQSGGEAVSRQIQQGQFHFQRPGRFRWEVLQPYEQLIVSDGQQVYQYDPDLDQVTRRSAGQAMGASPAALLFGSGSLEQAFELQGLPDSDGLQWLRAIPRSADAGFVHADIGFSRGLPRQIRLLDAFGQTTSISFSGLQANPGLPDDIFSFTIPPDIDLVEMD